MNEEDFQEELSDEDIAYTHKTILTVYSNADDSMISVRVQCDPFLDGKDIQELGYMPASYLFLQEYLLPAIEQGHKDWESDPMSALLEMSSPSKYEN